MRPSIADAPISVDAILHSLPNRFKPAMVGEYRGIFHFEITGAEHPRWTVRIEPGGCEVVQGHLGAPVCTITMSEKTFLAVETGRRNPVTAFVKGRIRVTNLGQLRHYDRLFHRFHAVPTTAEPGPPSGVDESS